MPLPSRRAVILLWTVQGLLALLFLFAGVTKLMMPAEALTAQSSLPEAFLRFIGVAETLGAIGLILPQWLGIRPALTSMAAAGLVIIMAGAAVVSWSMGGALMALLPFVIGILCAVVAYGRWRPVREKAVEDLPFRPRPADV